MADHQFGALVVNAPWSPDNACNQVENRRFAAPFRPDKPDEFPWRRTRSKLYSAQIAKNCVTLSTLTPQDELPLPVRYYRVALYAVTSGAGSTAFEFSARGGKPGVRMEFRTGQTILHDATTSSPTRRGVDHQPPRLNPCGSTGAATLKQKIPETGDDRCHNAQPRRQR